MSYSCIFVALLCFYVAASFAHDDTPPPPQDGCYSIRYTDPCRGDYVKFQLHTRRGSEAVQVTDSYNSIKMTKYNDRQRNIIVLHGFKNNMSTPDIVEIKDAYLKAGDYNVWTPDFSTLVRNPCYPFAVYNVPFIARCISNLVKGLRGASPEPYIHVIGFSLGAQVAGRVGYELRNRKVDRITGLDPALPLFFSGAPGNRLSPNDAKFVDVLHTNMFIKGHNSALGHVDFYLNGGSSQPGCEGGLYEKSSCDHHRAPRFFAESINSVKGFWGTKCSSLKEIVAEKCSKQPPFEKMGEGASFSARGQYLVKTARSSPFALGKP